MRPQWPSASFRSSWSQWQQVSTAAFCRAPRAIAAIAVLTVAVHGKVNTLVMAAGLLCNTYLPRFVAAVRPVLPLLSLVDTCFCVGASLSGAAVSQSPIAFQAMVPVSLFHILAFWLGHQLAAQTSAKGSVPLARAVSLQTGMQSSLLALLLATRFYPDPLVRLPCGLSVTVMTLCGFGLVLWWSRQSQPSAAARILN